MSTQQQSYAENQMAGEARDTADREGWGVSVFKSRYVYIKYAPFDRQLQNVHRQISKRIPTLYLYFRDGL